MRAAALREIGRPLSLGDVDLADPDALVSRGFEFDEINNAFDATNAGEVARGMVRF